MNGNFPLSLGMLVDIHAAKYKIEQKVEYDGIEDEIEGYCPLSQISLQENGQIKETYIGLGYNLKLARKTVLADELKAIENENPHLPS